MQTVLAPVLQIFPQARPRQVWRIGAECIGVKVKCRKSDRHYSADGFGRDLMESETMPDETVVKRVALQWLVKNMKSYSKAWGVAILWDVAPDGTATTVLMSDAHEKKFFIC